MVVTGIEIASYGRDLTPKSNLADAVEAIASKAGELRLRLGSLEPTVITEDFAKRLKATGTVCDHFHLSLQSGCDETLSRMNRKYDTARFFEATELLRYYFPACGMTADLIVGFPGETEENHLETLDFVRKCAFSSMHIFPFSKRPGTKAAVMEGQLSNTVKVGRAKQAQAVASEMEDAFLSACVGKKLQVLFETEKDAMSIGHAANYTLVCVPNGHRRGIVENVEIVSVLDKMLGGKIV